MRPLLSAMSIYQITPKRIAYLIHEAIELEKLKLEVHRTAAGDSIESHITILEGNRFLALIDGLESELGH